MVYNDSHNISQKKQDYPKINDKSGFKSFFNKIRKFIKDNFAMSLKCKILLLFVGIISFNCDNRTTVEMYKEELITPAFEGIVNSTELWKGGGLIVSLTEKKQTVGITNDHSVLEEIKREDFFKKLANSNKCYIRRGDSIFYF